MSDQDGYRLHVGGPIAADARVDHAVCSVCGASVDVDVPPEWSANVLAGGFWLQRVVDMTCPTVRYWPPSPWRRWLLRRAGYRVGEHEKVRIW